MFFDSPCKTGQLQVDEATVRVVASPFKRLIWEVPREAITGIALKKGAVMADLTIYTSQGVYPAQLLTKQNAEKFCALFPHIKNGVLIQQAVQLSQEPSPTNMPYQQPPYGVGSGQGSPPPQGYTQYPQQPPSSFNPPNQHQQGPGMPPYAPGMMPQPRPPQHPKKRNLPIWAWVIIVFVALVICSGISQSILQSARGQSTATQTATTVLTTNPSTEATAAAIDATAQALTNITPTDTPTPTIHYPPTTIDDLRGLAARGDVSAIHEFHSESTGLTGACPQPKREVTVDLRVTGQQLAEDLLAYFYAQQLDNPCGSVVFAYHTQAESGNGYTAGRILLDVTDSSGASNTDPNASNLKYTLTLDVGDLTTGQEYVVTY